MKTQLTIIFTFLAFLCFGQTQKNNEALCNLTIPYKPAVIDILTDTGTLYSSKNDGTIQIMNYGYMQPGRYKIQISGPGQPKIIRDSIVVTEWQDLVLHITFNGPCLYNHPAGYIPICPKNHKDNIIPIIYGLIVRRGNTSIKDSIDQKVKFGGCMVTDCDPQFYCKEHDIEF